MSSVQTARIRRTVFFRENRPVFMARLSADIVALIASAARRNLTPLIRLNGTSDLPWEHLPADGAPNLMARFPSVRFYDYTKNPHRMRRYLTDPSWPTNYSLTFSRSELNEHECKAILAAGGNVAIPFSTRKGEALPASWHGYRVTDGDLSDARPSDDHGVVIGLRAKGLARRDTSGFVVIPDCSCSEHQTPETE